MSPGQNLQYLEETVVASAERSTNGATGTLESYAGFETLRFHVLVEDVATAGQLVIGVDDTLDGVNWRTVANASSVNLSLSTTVPQVMAVLDITTPFAERLRVRWTLNNGCVATFSVRIAAQGPLT